MRIDDSGTASVDVDTDPWAIVRVDGVGRGKSPQKGLALPSGRPAQIELTSPTAGKMTVSLRANYLLSSRPN